MEENIIDNPEETINQQGKGSYRSPVLKGRKQRIHIHVGGVNKRYTSVICQGGLYVSIEGKCVQRWDNRIGDSISYCDLFECALLWS